jgi:methionyl-tRNA formyltransferase
MSKKVLFMGRKPVAAECLEWLVKSDLYEVVGVLTDDHLPVSITADVAKLHGIPLYKFNDALGAMSLGQLTFDIGFSMLYWRKLKGLFLSLPTLGTINFHPAPLPDFKGTGGYSIAIMKKLDEWGVSAHYTNESIDTGSIIQVKRFEFDSETATALSLEAQSQEMLFQSFVEVAELAANSDSRLETSPNNGGIYVSRPEMEAMKEVTEGDDVDKKIRAFWFPPYDGAFVSINGTRYTLVNPEILDELADEHVSNVWSKGR